jgi:hypothetical protein
VKPFDRFSATAPARTRRAAVVAVLAVVLVAGFVVWPSTPAEPNYLRAATAGGDYLVAQMNADGSFVYEYDPIKRKKSSSYNMLRHAGTTYSLIELHEATGDAEYLAAAENGLGYSGTTSSIVRPLPRLPAFSRMMRSNLGATGSRCLRYRNTWR